MKKKKTILGMLAALAVLVLLVPLASRVPGKRSQQEDTSAYLGIQTESITRLSLDAGEPLTFVKHNGAWTLEGEPEFPLDEKKIGAMVETLGSLQASKTIPGTEALGNYGLDTPLCRVEAGEMELCVGRDAAMDGGRYFSTGDGNVYITSDDILTPFRYTRLDLVKQETAPLMQVLETVTLERKGREPLVIRNRQGQNLAYSPEYIWFAETEAGPMALDTENTETLIRHGTDMTWEGCADDRAEDLGAYGFDSPTLRMTVSYTQPEEGVYTLEVGSPVSGQYYARINGSDVIYWMDAADVNALLEAEPGMLRPNEVLLMDWSRVESVVAELAGERYTFTPGIRQKQTQEAAEEEKPGETEIYWLLDGKEADLSPILSGISDMVPVGFAEGTPELARELCVTVFQDNPRFPEVTVAFHRYTGENSLVTMNGEPTVLVSRGDVIAVYEAITKVVLG